MVACIDLWVGQHPIKMPNTRNNASSSTRNTATYRSRDVMIGNKNERLREIRVEKYHSFTRPKNLPWNTYHAITIVRLVAHICS